MTKKPKILLIDLKDSFTYNLVQLLENLGAEVTVRTYGVDVISVCNDYDKILISPGPGIPSDYPTIFEIIRTFQNRKPILGICLGHQAIGCFYGAKLEQLARVQHGQTIQLFPGPAFKGSSLDGISLPGYVALYHSWALKSENFPSILNITCLSREGIIMGIKHNDYEVEGFQFHPESYMTEIGRDLLDAWLKRSI
ncbi:MAG: aminodeoxychorismate/anthranilate synthase component II [Saprospiraceae bacterium]|nr:aminodeoxychorismate/anthranilate synthase component II [Candidatus Vicinibacter affinis]MBK9960656.1 aminodeoxychorismate/anthranilate synthase component II [Candidatus Vicinibacter affinis]